MALKYLIISAICILQTVCHQCEWRNMRTKYNETWQILHGMTKDVPNECLLTNDRNLQIKSRLPMKVLGKPMEEGDVLKTVLETFRQINKIVNKYLKEETDCNLCINLHRIIDDLEECIRPVKKKRFKNSRKIYKFFKKLENYLKDKKYGLCAWEMVKIEIKTLLPDVQDLMMKL